SVDGGKEASGIRYFCFILSHRYVHVVIDFKFFGQIKVERVERTLECRRQYKSMSIRKVYRVFQNKKNDDFSLSFLFFWVVVPQRFTFDFFKAAY
ncbi:hypothetical protein KMT30_48875, partial [Streptomyces sp. IBSBF 2953]|nr:hypothetical protein [Streptomyces hayashii]